MPINKVAVQSVLKRIPVQLRNAARQERQALIAESKKDPIAASFMAAKGQVPFFNNSALSEKLAEVNKQIVAECYATAKAPSGTGSVFADIVNVVKASSIF